MTLDNHSTREGDPSSWGVIETAERLANGIVCVHTPSHGGIWLSEARLAQMPPGERSTDGWYEEDCEAAFPLRRFREEVLHVYPADRPDPYIETMMRYSAGSFAKFAMNRKP